MKSSQEIMCYVFQNAHLSQTINLLCKVPSNYSKKSTQCFLDDVNNILKLKHMSNVFLSLSQGIGANFLK
jgi:hypothetical protein